MAVPSQAAAAGLASIRLTAERDVLRADGKSATILTAEVRDDRGNVVPDGTRVRFSTTAGRLETTVVGTQNGVARVLLTAADIETAALVTATLETPGQAAPVQRVITFTLQTEEEESNWAHLEGPDYIGYVMDDQVIQANGRNGGARLYFRNLTLSASALQVEVKTSRITAVGEVTLERGGVKRRYSALRLEMLSGQGVGITEAGDEDKPRVVTVQGPRLEETPVAADQPAAKEPLALLDLSNAGVAVVARSISFEPGNRLQFRRATFYIDGQKTATLPYHIMSLNQDSLFQEQILGLGPAGVTVDFPLYYDVRPSAVGTFHIRHGARVGSSAYATKPGWSLDIEQAYNGGNGGRRMDGVFELTGVTRQDWGARLRHGQRLDAATRANVFMDFPNHRDLFGTTQVARQFRGFTVSAMGSGSRSVIQDLVTGERSSGGYMRGQLYAETDPHAFLGVSPLRYALSLSTSRQSFYGPSAGISQGVVNTHTAGMRFFTKPLAVAPLTNVMQTVSVGQTWVSGEGKQLGLRSGPSVLATTSLNRTLGGGLGYAQLNYDLTQQPSLSAGALAATGKHRLGLNVGIGAGNGWNFTLAASRGLDVTVATLYSSLDFPISGPWRGRVTMNASRMSDFRYQDTEYALIRRIAGRDIAVYYSTTAKRFQLDLSGARF